MPVHMYCLLVPILEVFCSSDHTGLVRSLSAWWLINIMKLGGGGWGGDGD